MVETTHITNLTGLQLEKLIQEAREPFVARIEIEDRTKPAKMRR
jgi:hypothetical protein